VWWFSWSKKARNHPSKISKGNDKNQKKRLDGWWGFNEM